MCRKIFGYIRLLFYRSATSEIDENLLQVTIMSVVYIPMTTDILTDVLLTPLFYTDISRCSSIIKERSLFPRIVVGLEQVPTSRCYVQLLESEGKISKTYHIMGNLKQEMNNTWGYATK